MPKLKVLQFVNRMNIGGQVSNALLLTKYLRPDYDTMLISGLLDKDEASMEYLAQSLEIQPHFVPNMFREIKLKNDYQAYNYVRKIIKEFKPDIVHTHAAKAGAIGRLAASKEKVPVIVHTFHGHVFHSYFGPRKTKVFINIERHLAKKSTGIIALSEIQKMELSQEFKICAADKIKVIPLGFDLHVFQENTREKRKKFREKYEVDDFTVAIGIIGRLVPIKNHSFFLQSIDRLLSKTNQKIKVFIIGDGEDRQKIEDLAKRLGIAYSTEHSDHHARPLVFTSWMKEVDEAKAGLDIIALTSLNEGTPVSLIEASAAGKPIVSTNVGGVANVVRPDVNAYLVEKDDVEGFAHKLQILSEHKELRLKMGLEGIEHAFSKYSHVSLVENVSDFYERLMIERK